MNTIYLFISCIAFLGLPLGIFLNKIVKTEIRQGEKFFKLIKIIGAYILVILTLVEFKILAIFLVLIILLTTRQLKLPESVVFILLGLATYPTYIYPITASTLFLYFMIYATKYKKFHLISLLYFVPVALFTSIFG